MPFGFVGVNHHGKSIVFAAALISHEDIETFVWVFNQWMKCMGKAPLGILTDQCKAIGKVVDLVFKGVPHLLCLWHIVQNATKNLGSLSKWKELQVALIFVISDCLDPDEFEEVWEKMVEKFELQENTWIQETFTIRKQWALSHWYSTFWAGLSSTLGSEGMNRYFKIYFSIDKGLVQFMEYYELAMKGKIEDEKQCNYSSKEKPLPCNKTMLVQYVFHKAYTNEKFKKLKEEIEGLQYTYLEHTSSLGSINFYKADEKIPKPLWKK